MATAKKRTTKTDAARTAAKKAPAAKGPATAGKTSKKAAPSKPVRGAAKAVPKVTKPARPSAPKGKSARSQETAAKRPAKAAPRKSTASKVSAVAPRVEAVDESLFLPLSEGERADALRVLTADSRLKAMASVGRYRVIAAEPLAVKPPHELAGRRLARLVVYDYAADRSVDACVDLDQSSVPFLKISRAQPMLARDEEEAAMAIALADERVKEQLSLGDEPQAAMHYWSNRDSSLSYARRSAAVIFGRPGVAPSLIAVVDLLDNLVSEVVPAAQW